MRRGAALGLSLSALIVLIAPTSRSATVLAGVGSLTSLPADLKKAKSGLRMTIDTNWVDANGYRPVRIRLENWPPRPAPADRAIEVELRPNAWTKSAFDIAVRTVIEIPQGGAGVVHTVSTPQSRQWDRLAVEAWEDGRRLEELCTRDIGIARRGRFYHSEAVPAILVVDRGAPTRTERRSLLRSPNAASGGRIPDIRELAKYLPRGDDTSLPQGEGDIAVLQVLDMMPMIEVLPPADLPDRWIDYTCFDIIFISLTDLKALALHHAGPWRAIRDWAASGPTLCVYEAGTHFERLAPIEHLLGLGQLLDEDSVDPGYRGWTAPHAKHYREETAAFQKFKEGDRAWAPRVRQTETETTRSRSRKSGAPTAPSPPTFVFRKLDLGHVVAFGPKRIFPGDEYQWGWFFNSLSTRHWMWYQRHGVSLRRPNDDFWNFLIPGVGLAPVKSFLVLILLFVVVMGPVNYALLRRSRRLYLLLVTVPVGAAVVVSGLFVWALVSDGLGVRARVRSFTQIDQRRARVVSWSRQSYYAGLVPSGGLSFPSDAAVYPLEYSAEPSLSGGGRRRMVWGQRQHYTAGYMQSRVTSQFMVVRSAHARAALLITWPEGEKARPQIENRLGSRILQLVVRGEAGQDYWARGIDAGARCRPEAVETAAAASRLRRVFSDNQPANPPKFDPRDYRQAFAAGFGARRYYSWEYGHDGNLSEPSTAHGVLEANLRRLSGNGIQALAPRSYVAVVQSSSEVPLGIESAREEASLHVILGTW